MKQLENIADNEIEIKQAINYNSKGRNIVIGGAWPYANNSLHYK